MSRLAALAVVVITALPVHALALERVFITGNDVADRASELLVGEGITEGGVTSSGGDFGSQGRIVWAKTRELTDFMGVRHLFYRQYLVDSSQLHATLSPEFGSQIGLLLAEIGLHFEANGSLFLVSGYQTRDLRTLVIPVYTTPEAAAYLAYVALSQWGDLQPIDPPLDARTGERGAALASRADRGGQCWFGVGRADPD